MRIASIILILLGIAWLAWYRFGGVPAPQPDAMDGLDPLVAELVSDGVDLVNRHRRNRDARMQLCMVYDANRMNDLARECYQQLTSHRNSDSQAWYRLALLHEREGDVSGALRAMQQMLSMDDSYAPAHWRVGYWQLDAGDLESALAAFDQAIALSHSSLPAWFGKARVHISRGEHDEAIALIEQRLVSSSESRYARHLLAQAYRRAGRMADAQQLDGTSPTVPAWSDPWADEINQFRTGYANMRLRAEYLVSRGQFDEAIALLERLQTETEEDAPLLNMLGVSYFTQGRTDLAFRTFERALELDPQNYPTLINLARAYLQMAQRSAVGDDYALSMALTEAQRAARINPDAGATHVLIGRIYTQMNQPADAVDAYKNAFQLDSRDPQPLLQAAMLEVQLERWDDALASGERLLQRTTQAGQTGDAHLIVAMAHHGRGETAHAAERYEQARQLGISPIPQLRQWQQELDAALSDAGETEHE